MKRKIESLTPEQKATFPAYVEEWKGHGLSTDPADRPRAEAAIRLMYANAGLKEPRIVWTQSPLGNALAFAVLKDPRVRASVRDSVRASVGASVGASVWDSVRASVGASVRDSVRASVGASVGARRSQCHPRHEGDGWMSRTRLSVALGAFAILAGCECKQTFADGEIVEHRLLGGRYNVLQSSDTPNVEGLCLVTVRDEKGNLLRLATTELQPAQE